MNQSEIQKIVEGINTMVRQMMPAITELQVGLNAYRRMFKDISATIAPIARQISRALEQHKLNIQTGWWYPNYIVDDLRDDQVHTALVNEAEKGTFTRLVVNESRRNDFAALRSMRERWEWYSFIKPSRKKVLLSILDAHMAKQYTLTIPVAIAQVEHFYRAIFPKQKEPPLNYAIISIDDMEKLQQANYARYFHLNSAGRVPASVFFETYPIYHYFVNILFATEKLRDWQKFHKPELYKLSNPNSRHKILHGENANYASEGRSLKQILLLDKLLLIIYKSKKARE